MKDERKPTSDKKGSALWTAPIGARPKHPIHESLVDRETDAATP
jgi:hypothetical protein